MKKIIYVFLMIAIFLLLLNACSQAQLPVTDVSVSETGDITASVTPRKDMNFVTVLVVAKDSEGNVNFEGELPLPKTFPKDTKTVFSFSIFDSNLWGDASFSYDPFGDMYKSFLEDSVTCGLMFEGKEIASFEVDTAQIDLEKVFPTTDPFKKEYDENGVLISIGGIPIAPDAGNKNYQGVGDPSVYQPIESFGVTLP